MKVRERRTAQLIYNRVNQNEMQFGCVSSSGTMDATFLMRQLQEKYLAKSKPLFVVFVDMGDGYYYLAVTVCS